MARIRSVHPGFFTDADYAFLSDAAQLFAVGLWTECDDQGIFEWKPRELKLRLRPGKDGPVDSLLEELVTANAVKRFDHDGRSYGLVRNFRRYQRPKKPNQVHFMPDEFRTYVGLTTDSSELSDDEADEVPPKGEPPPRQRPPVPPKSEKSPQMEDGGDNRKGGEEVDTHRTAKPRASRGCRIPPDFVPDEVTFTHPDMGPLTPQQRRSEVARFRDYWLAQAGKNATKSDWQAAWRYWLRNAKPYQNTGGRNGVTAPRNPVEEGFAFTRGLVERREAAARDDDLD